MRQEAKKITDPTIRKTVVDFYCLPDGSNQSKVAKRIKVFLIAEGFITQRGPALYLTPRGCALAREFLRTGTPHP